MKENTVKENKLGNMPINKLVLNMSIPIIISMTIQGLYNFVDSYFVAQMSQNAAEAITAMTLGLPLQMLIIAVAVGSGVGLNAVISRNLGMKQTERANAVAGNGILLGLLLTLLFMGIGLLTIRPFFEFQTDNPIVIEQGILYMQIITTCAGAKIFQIFLERMLESTGRATLSMMSLGFSALANIIMDPIFIFVFDMGVQGAAIATILAQVLGALLGLYFNVHFNHELHFARRYLKLEGHIIKEIYQIGLPAMIMQALQSLSVFGINTILYTISETAVTAYGIYFRIQQLIFMPVFGLNNALIPIISYNYGAQNAQRIKKAIITALKFGALMMGTGVLIFEFFPGNIVDLFNPSSELRELCIQCLRISATSYLFAEINFVLLAAFQALNEGKKALLLTLFRTFIILLPFTFLFSLFDNAATIVWFAMPCSESLTMIIAVLMFKRLYQKKCHFDTDLPLS